MGLSLAILNRAYARATSTYVRERGASVVVVVVRLVVVVVVVRWLGGVLGANGSKKPKKPSVYGLFSTPLP